MRSSMRGVARISILVSLFLALFVPAASAQVGNPPRNAILNSWDGFDRLVLWELLAKQKLPNLAAIIREGSLQEIRVTGHRTETKPSHAEMLTGMAAKDTGVITNYLYQPIPEGYTIFERLQAHLGGREHVRTFMVVAGIAHVGGRSAEEVRAWMEDKSHRHTPRKDGRTLPPGADDVKGAKEYYSEPFFLTKRALDAFDADRRDVSVTVPVFLSYLERFKSPRFLAFVHFSDPDHANHMFGSDSWEYREAAMACDQGLGRIVEWLKKEGLYGETLLYVTTDHGADLHSHKHNNAPHSWLATNDPLVTHGGILADIPATILVRFGVDLSRIEPKLIGSPLTGPGDPLSAVAAPDWPAGPLATPRQKASWLVRLYQGILRHLGLEKAPDRHASERRHVRALQDGQLPRGFPPEMSPKPAPQA